MFQKTVNMILYVTGAPIIYFNQRVNVLPLNELAFRLRLVVTNPSLYH